MASEGKYTDVYDKLARTTGCVKDFKRTKQGRLQEISFTEEDGEVEWKDKRYDVQHLIETVRDQDTWTEVAMRSFVKVETGGDELQERTKSTEDEPQGATVGDFFIGSGVIIAVIAALFWIITPSDSGEAENDRNTPQAKVERQFHPWDGRHRALEDLVVDNLNDPNSFEHLESRYTHNESERTIRVWMDYTASNRMGGTVRGTAIAVFDYDGDVVDITQLE